MEPPHRPQLAPPAGTARFSVTMTVRNEAATIERALDSILGQLSSGEELVVVDAFSTDGTWAVLEERARRDPRLKPHQAVCNRGQGRNVALGFTRSRVVVTHIDGDVSYAPGVIPRAAQVLLDSPETPMLWVVGRSDPVPSSTKFMVWQRDVLLGLGGYPPTQESEDCRLMLRTFHQGVRVRRFVVERVGSALDAYLPGSAPNYPPWLRFRHYYTGVDRWLAIGSTYPDYLRILYVTRVNRARFLAAAGLGVLRYLARGRRAIVHEPDPWAGEPAKGG